MNGLVKFYFGLGLSNTDILDSLAVYHGMYISRRTLHRVQRMCNIYRRKHQSDELDVALYIMKQMDSPSRLLGYKMMHLKCIQHGFVISQNSVRHLMHIISPNLIEARKRRCLQRRVYRNQGPNFVWHMDSYDKLTPYGICVNGAVDGFSRYIIWLEANTTNSNPRVIASYFLTEIRKRGGCPSFMRADKGTENGHVRQMLTFMRRQQNRNCFFVGSSNHNQRIERMWGIIRQMNAQYWMELFSSLKDMGLFTGDFLDKSLIQFCFMELIQKELNGVANLWNTHKIRRSGGLNLAAGKPVIMYMFPERYGAENYLCEVDMATIDVCETEATPRGPVRCDETVYELCLLLMEDGGRQQPDSPDEGVFLYQYLRAEILQGLQYS